MNTEPFSTETLQSSPLSDLNHSLGRNPGLSMDRSLDELDAMVAAVAPVFDTLCGVRLDPADGEQALFAIDRLLRTLRDGAEDSTRYPTQVLMALGLVSLKVVRDLAGDGDLVTYDDNGVVVPVRTLAQAAGFPALRIGARIVPVSQRVAKRWHDPEQSLVDLWARIQVEREAPIDMEAPTDESPVALDPELLLISSIAPFAGFLHIAIADGEVEPSELLIFRMGMLTCESELLRKIVIHCPLDAEETLAHLLENPSLVPRSLAGIGALLRQDPAAMAELMSVFERVAQSGSSPGADERRALAEVERMLEGGAERAKNGPPPFPDEYDYQQAALAPISAFILVASADGELEEKETRAFHSALKRVSNPLLQRLIALGTADFEANLRRLAEEDELATDCLKSAGQLFRTHPEGPAAREALMALLRHVAEVHGELRREERRALRAIEHLLDDTSPIVWPGIGVLLGLLQTVVVGGWFGLAAVSGAGYSLPIALVLQGLCLVGALMLTRSQGRFAQFLSGGVASFGAAMAMGVWTVILGALFSSVPPVGLVLGGVGGVGLLLSLAMAVVFPAP